ncbi:hypothetical protein KUCAC02_036508 [Chaenocephalus aceratus]|nr:hypothetical protein KUCAC02_036508 [Chaenocephalus aceratus]
MQQQRLSSQDATGEAVVPGCNSRGCPPRMQQQRLSSQDAAAEAVLPGCSRRGCPPRMQQQRLSSQDAAGRHSRGLVLDQYQIAELVRAEPLVRRTALCSGLISGQQSL